MEKEEHSRDKILLRGTLYVYINAGRYFFFEVRTKKRGVVKNFQAAEGHYGKISNIFLVGVYVDIHSIRIWK